MSLMESPAFHFSQSSFLRASNNPPGDPTLPRLHLRSGQHRKPTVLHRPVEPTPAVLLLPDHRSTAWPRRGRLRGRSDQAGSRAQELGSELTALFTSAPILASSVAVNSFSAKEVGHMAPSPRFASSLKPSVAYLELNFCALWKKQTTLPSLAYAGIPYQVFGERAGALALMIAWSRSAMARSGSGISAIFASTALSPPAFSARGPRRASDFSSWARSFIAARSSSVNALDFFALIVPSCAGSPMSYSVQQEEVYSRPLTLTSRVLIGLVTCFATHDGIPAVARAAWSR